MTEPFLERAQRDASGGHRHAKGVAQVVEASLRQAGRRQGGVEA
jgi:hypothetical protein